MLSSEQLANSISNEGTMPKEHSGNAGLKRKYQPPLLTLYGALRDLTRSGGGSQIENTLIGKICVWWGDAKSKYPCASDRNIKENIVRIGVHPLGISLYLFDYKPGFRDEWGHGRQFGVMAQEVEKIMPEAVCVHPDGYKAVDYEMLGISRPSH
jgi:hypothetical protein